MARTPDESAEPHMNEARRSLQFCEEAQLKTATPTGSREVLLYRPSLNDPL
jgi:hypothetical protein